MKQSEKLDLLLRSLYKRRNDGYFPISDFIDENRLEIANNDELKRLVKRLQDDKFIQSTGITFPDKDFGYSITSKGIDYCEGDSYTYRGQSLITNNYSISVNGSSNTSIVQNSQNVTITNNADIKGIIAELRCALESAKEIESAKKRNMVDCLDEAETVVSAGKTPKATIMYLLSIAADIATLSPVVYGLVKSLGQSIGITLP